MHPLGPRRVQRYCMIEITARNLPDLVSRTHDHRELFRIMFLSPGPIADKGGKETREPVGFV